MKISIIGSTHAFGRGENAAATLFNFWDEDETAFKQLNTGYPGILSSMYNQHQFHVVPILDGGNKDIVYALSNLIDEKPSDMYIVQMTSWHNFARGWFFYSKQEKSVHDNLSYHVYHPGSYYNQLGDNRDEENLPYFPNYNLCFKPGQDRGAPIPGTGTSDFIYNVRFQDFNLNYAIEDSEMTNQLLIQEHLRSRLFVDDNYTVYKMMYNLSKQHNIWYFYWNVPFGNALDFQYVIPKQIGKVLTDYTALLHNKWINLDHEKEISNIPIMNMLHQELTSENVENICVDRKQHLNNFGHELVVEHLLSNPKFKEALNG